MCRPCDPKCVAPETFKKGASGNLPRIIFRLLKTAEHVALQAQRL
jgi:hypothetical protein